MTVDELRDQFRVRQTDNGYEATRMFRVSDVPDSAAGMISAMSAPQIPRLGSLLPGVRDCLCKSIDSVTVGMTAEITVTYGSRDANGGLIADLPPRYSLDSSAIEEAGHVNIAYLPALVATLADYRPTQQNAADAGVPLIQEMVEVPRYRPMTTLTVELFGRPLPLGTAERFVGSTNIAQWLGGRPETWMCTQIGAQGDDPNRMANVYRFQYNRDTWRKLAFIRVDGKIPGDVARPPVLKIVDITGAPIGQIPESPNNGAADCRVARMDAFDKIPGLERVPVDLAPYQAVR